MAETQQAGYLFLPHLRSGLSSFLPKPNNTDTSTDKRAALDIDLNLKSYKVGPGSEDSIINKAINMVAIKNGAVRNVQFRLAHQLW